MSPEPTTTASGTPVAPSARPAPAPRQPTLSHRVEYAATRATIALLSAMSWARAGALGARIGRLGYRPLGIRRGVVESQIAASFPEWSKSRVRETAREAYEHLGRTFVEAAVLPGLGKRAVLDRFSGSDGFELVEAAMQAGRGLLLVTGHLGNWELGGAYVAARGVPLDAVARGMGNPLFDAYITETRTRLGMHVVHDAEAVRRLPRAAREGRATALLADQGVKGLASTFVPFFGRVAKTPRGPAVFALRLKIPLVFTFALREADGRYRMIFEDVPYVDTGDKEADVDRIVADYTAVLEKWVRRAPGQYFWHHRRWKRQPEPGDRIGMPTGSPPPVRDERP